jgi:hypothetical protein
MSLVALHAVVKGDGDVVWSRVVGGLGLSSNETITILGCVLWAHRLKSTVPGYGVSVTNCAKASNQRGVMTAVPKETSHGH